MAKDSNLSAYGSAILGTWGDASLTVIDGAVLNLLMASLVLHTMPMVMPQYQVKVHRFMLIK
ncbi:hypothetical protein O5558_03500 [Escherichia coli]|nr:hypothetical protein [Escherichia coli]